MRPDGTVSTTLLENAVLAPAAFLSSSLYSTSWPPWTVPPALFDLGERDRRFDERHFVACFAGLRAGQRVRPRELAFVGMVFGFAADAAMFLRDVRHVRAKAHRHFTGFGRRRGIVFGQHHDGAAGDVFLFELTRRGTAVDQCFDRARFVGQSCRRGSPGSVILALPLSVVPLGIVVETSKVDLLADRRFFELCCRLL